MKVNERKLRLEVLEGRDTPSAGLSDLAAPVAAPPPDQMMVQIVPRIFEAAQRLYGLHNAYSAQVQHTRFGEGTDLTAARRTGNCSSRPRTSTRTC